MRTRIEQTIRAALLAAHDAGEIPAIELDDLGIERPRDESFGDWATSVAMRAAKQAKMSPRALAEIIASHIAQSEEIAKVEVAGPGFINLTLSPCALQSILEEIMQKGDDFGRCDLGHGQKMQIEFVSANPVGPMHVGHGRWAALGDAMCSILDHAGYQCDREYYINDAGVQMDIFAMSVSARYLELCGQKIDFPENGYQGTYIIDIAQGIFDAEGTRWQDASEEEREAYFKERAYKQVLDHLHEVLSKMGVEFDTWFSERTLHAINPETGINAIQEKFNVLHDAGYLYEKDGALWFRTTDFGDDKDRVLVKADGDYTYFAADIAYHANKFDRGYERLIDIWGADHHGYVPRMKAACAALGHPGQFEVMLGQLVTLYRDGVQVRMSKRTGEMVTLEELLDEVGNDAARYFFLRRSIDQALDFDIELAKRTDSDNPVYYVQYAHARMCSVLRKAQEEGITLKDNVDLSVLTQDAELALMRKLGEFGDVIKGAAHDLAPFRLTHYAEDLAAEFHRFYTKCHILGEPEEICQARLYELNATRTALALLLKLLGVSAPEKM